MHHCKTIDKFYYKLIIKNTAWNRVKQKSIKTERDEDALVA